MSAWLEEAMEKSEPLAPLGVRQKDLWEAAQQFLKGLKVAAFDPAVPPLYRTQESRSIIPPKLQKHSYVTDWKVKALPMPIA